jgi:mitochondrial intermediate peptidase
VVWVPCNLDLHPRQGKYTHAAHFTVRGGCVVDGPNSEYQLPIVALVCNMNTGSASFSSHQEVETLFHEFGHAMHSLLSRTNFQHMSGTRAAMDFVETPSHWMEHYAWDAQFLPFLAIHARTGEPIPEQYIQSLRHSRDQFRCIELQSQIVLAMFDQQIFGIQRQQANATTMGIWSELHRQSGVPHANGTHWYTNVGHLVTYGAGYYGYLYSQVFASDIWNQLFQGKCLKRESGELMWKKLLMHGGSRDANLILRDVLGREPAVDHFLGGLS